MAIRPPRPRRNPGVSTVAQSVPDVRCVARTELKPGDKVLYDGRPAVVVSTGCALCSTLLLEDVNGLFVPGSYWKVQKVS